MTYAHLHGMTLHEGGHLFIDRGKSGYYLDGRDGLAELRRLAQEGGRGFDELICEHLDRVSRNIVHVLQIYHELKSLGIEIHVTSSGVGRVDDVHAVFYGLIGMEQRTRMLRLMSQGSWRAALRGRNVGSIPYGYNRGPEAGDLVVDPFEAEVVRRIFRLFDAGVNARQIAYMLNTEKLPSPSGSSTWTSCKILGTAAMGSGILRNPKYVGVYIYGKMQTVRRPDSPAKKLRMRPSSSWAYGAKPEWSIVDRSLWLRVLCRLKEMKDVAAAKKPREKRSAKSTLLFHGRYSCVCGSPLWIAFKGNSTGRRMRCSSELSGGLCDRSRSTSSNFVEYEVLREIRDTVLSSTDLPMYAEECEAELRRLEEEVAVETRHRLARIAELDDWLETSIDKAINKGGTDEDLARARIKKRAERSEHQLALAALPDISSKPRFDPSAIDALKDAVDKIILRLPIVATSEADLMLVQALRKLVTKVVLDQPNGERGYTLKITFCPAALVAPSGLGNLAERQPVTVRRNCPPPTAIQANVEERKADLRARADRNEYGLSDEDWRIVEPIIRNDRAADGRTTMDAALFYLRSGKGFTSLPSPYGGLAMRYRVRVLVLNGEWRRAYDALTEAGSPAVRNLDVTRFASLENRKRERVSGAT